MKSILALFSSLLCIPLAGCNSHQPGVADPTPLSKPSEVSKLLTVKVAGKYGYMNTSGQLVINPQFDAAEAFSEGRAVVCIGKPGDSRWGYIDETGKMVVTPQYLRQC